MAGAIVIFAPHPDDETLACGGIIAAKVKEGRDVHIVFTTDGRNSHLHELGIPVDPTPQELAQIRKEEARRATSILGVKPKNLIFLGFEDGTLSLNKETAKGKVSEVMVLLRPKEIYYPDGSDVHRDHRATYEVVEDCLNSLDLVPQKYRYTVWSAEEKRKENAEGQVAVDISDVLQLKKNAINEYRSQITLFSRGQTRPVLSDQFLAKFRVGQELFTTEPPVRAAPVGHRVSNE